MRDVGRIAIRGDVIGERVVEVLQRHWAGCSPADPAMLSADPLALQQGRADTLGFVVRHLPNGWVVVADTEEATADAALAEALSEALEVPVLWFASAPSADAARVTWFGTEEDAPDEGGGPAGLEAWLDVTLPGWRAGWADEGGTRVAFRGVDSDLYVDDSAWLTPTPAQAGSIQVRSSATVDPEAVVREVAAYWLDCGALPGDSREVPADSCGVIAGGSDRLVVAISPVIDGWITVVDSEREVADLGLADWLAAVLEADVAWYWVDSEQETAAIRLFGFEELDEEPADAPEDVVAFVMETFPLPFIPIDAVDASWTKLGFKGVDPEEYVTDPSWLDEQIAETES